MWLLFTCAMGPTSDHGRSDWGWLFGSGAGRGVSWF